MSQNSEPKKLTIVLQGGVANNLVNAKEVLQLTTYSGTISLSIEILDWILQKQKEGFVVKAEKESGDKIIIQEVPLKKVT